jgi:hypothetical protein
MMPPALFAKVKERFLSIIKARDAHPVRRT